VDLWKAVAKEGRDLPITDPEMTRFVMTLEQACRFIVEAIRDMIGGETFLPELPSMRLLDLARAVIAAYAPGPCGVVTVGLRPGGEKVHERMLSDEEPKRTLHRPGRFLVQPPHRTWSLDQYDGGEPLPEVYPYRSDIGHFLVEEDLQILLKEEPER
jgi:UDP-N-acetylglucosamine 4,6-dehydratase